MYVYKTLIDELLLEQYMYILVTRKIHTKTNLLHENRNVSSLNLLITNNDC